MKVINFYFGEVTFFHPPLYLMFTPNSKATTKFQLSSVSWIEMGYKYGRDCSGDTRSCASGDSCEPNSCDGLVQRQASEGMEKYIPFDREECKGGRIGFVEPDVDGGKESVVGVSDGYTITGEGTLTCVGNTASNLTDASVVQSEPNGKSVRKKNVGRAANFNFSHGEQACYEVDTSLPTNCSVQSSWVVAGIGDGSVTTQHNNVPKRGLDEGDAEVDRMEFEGGGEIHAAFR